MTNIDIATAYEPRKEKEPTADPFGLLIAVIKEKPNAGAVKHKAAYMRLVLPADLGNYGEYLVEIVESFLSLKYNTAVRAAMPPTAYELTKRREARQQAQQHVQDVVDRIATTFVRLDIVMPDGRPFGDWNRADCIKLGGVVAKVAERLNTRQKVRDVFSDERLAKLCK